MPKQKQTTREVRVGKEKRHKRRGGKIGIILFNVNILLNKDFKVCITQQSTVPLCSQTLRLVHFLAIDNATVNVGYGSLSID